MTTPPRPASRYAEAGVDIDRGNDLVDRIRPLVRATRRPGADAEIGGFGGLFDLRPLGYADPILVAANDGVGTKVKIAIETDRHDTIGIDLVAMCVNDLIVQGAEPLFFLDYFASARIRPDSAAEVIKGIAAGCRQAGAALIGGETAEMPGLYHGDDYDLAGFAVGVVERGDLLPRRDLAAGDALLGLASSGVHSNGFSLVRKIAADAGLKWSDPAPFQPETPLGLALLEPTRIYVKPLLKAIRATGAVKALAHITGGGFPDNIPRILPTTLAARVKLGAITPPAVFGWLKAAGRMDEEEMLRVFNCGVGMVVVVAADSADRVAKLLEAEGETVQRLGSLEARAGAGVVFDGALRLADR